MTPKYKAHEMLKMFIAIVTANDCGLLHKADFKLIKQIIKEATKL
jgi:hypothetical protein